MELISITDTSDSRLDPYLRLTDTQLRNKLEPEKGICIVESEIAIERALDCGAEPISLVVVEDRLEHMRPLMERMGDTAEVYVLPAQVAEQLTGYAVTRGVLSAMHRPKAPALGALLDASDTVAVLEGLTDTSNVGAIIRNAAALGIDTLICAPTCADPFNRRSIRVSMGNAFALPCVRLEGEWKTDSTLKRELFEALREHGFHTVALALADDALVLGTPEADARLGEAPKQALFLGSEGYGLSSDVIASCDTVARMEMARGTDSLNVAAASAIAFWELARLGR